jgi:hypothetical protein
MITIPNSQESIKEKNMKKFMKTYTSKREVNRSLDIKKNIEKPKMKKSIRLTKEPQKRQSVNKNKNRKKNKLIEKIKQKKKTPSKNIFIKTKTPDFSGLSNFISKVKKKFDFKKKNQ